MVLWRCASQRSQERSITLLQPVREQSFADCAGATYAQTDVLQNIEANQIIDPGRGRHHPRSGSHSGTEGTIKFDSKERAVPRA